MLQSGLQVHVNVVKNGGWSSGLGMAKQQHVTAGVTAL